MMVSVSQPWTMQPEEIDEGISDVWTTKTKELFYLCDPSNKGYVTKEDLYRLKDELGLDGVEVENAFDQLDKGRDEYITMEEFTEGFGQFLGVETTSPSFIKNVVVEDHRLRPDFVFQVFSLLDHDDKGYITKQDFVDSATTLEVETSQVEDLVDKFAKTYDNIYFEDFARNIDYLIDISPALQEVKQAEENNKIIALKRKILSIMFKTDCSEQEDSEVEQLLCEQAAILFKLCDKENKSYITSEDLCGLSRDLALPDEHIKDVFHSLDKNHNGYLSVREFSNGFHLFFDNTGLEDEGDFINDNITKRYEKAEELFNLCDKHGKGYVTKEDLGSFIAKVGIPEQQLSNVFQQLDVNHNGEITFDDFLSGFLEYPEDDEVNGRDSNNNMKEDDFESGFDERYLNDCRSSRQYSTPSRKNNKDYHADNSNCSRQSSERYECFNDVADERIDLTDDDDISPIITTQLKELRNIVSNSANPQSVTVFEDFLGKVYNELKLAKDEAKHLEVVLEKKSLSHKVEMKRVYEEMEQHLQNEKSKLRERESRKESELLEDVQNELRMKTQQLDKYVHKHTSLEERLKEVNEKALHLKNQNAELVEEKLILESKLNCSIDNMEILQSNLQRLEEQTSFEKKETLRAAVHATEGFQQEHESLVRELDELRATNDKLRDDRDALELSLGTKPVGAGSWADEVDGLKIETKELELPQIPPIESTMSKYVKPSEPVKPCSEQSRTPGAFCNGESTDNGSWVSPSKSSSSSGTPSKKGSLMSSYFEPVTSHVHPTVIENDNLHEDDDDEIFCVDESPLYQVDEDGDIREVEFIDPTKDSNDSVPSVESSASVSRTPSSARQTPVGMNAEDDISDSGSDVEASADHPSRLYKIVLVGDSSVGKSAFIHKFCHNAFKNANPTVGIDFQVKTMKINHEYIALQLWDTPGRQQRFQSSTKSYFSRADGVIVMFDLSSESSFANVKGWMSNFEEDAEPDSVLMLLGNKLDLVEQDDSMRQVSSQKAQQLAKDYNSMYYEVSSFSGNNLKESIEILASNIQFLGKLPTATNITPSSNKVCQCMMMNGEFDDMDDEVRKIVDQKKEKNSNESCDEVTAKNTEHSSSEEEGCSHHDGTDDGAVVKERDKDKSPPKCLRENNEMKSTISKMKEKYLKFQASFNNNLDRIDEEGKDNNTTTNNNNGNRALQRAKDFLHGSLDEILLDKSNEISGLQCELSRKNDVIGLLNEKIDCYSSEISRKSIDITRLQTELQKSNNETHHKTLELDKTQTTVGKLEHQISTINQQNCLLTQAVRDKDSQIGNLQGGVVSLNRKLGESVGEIKRLEEAVKRLDTIVKICSKDNIVSKTERTISVSEQQQEVDVIIVHDSLLNYVPTALFKNEGLRLKKIWAPSIKKAYEIIVTLKTLPRVVLLHTSTYDLDKMSEQEIVDWVEKIYFALHYRGIKMIYSGIAPRDDTLDSKGQLVNAMVASKMGSVKEFYLCRNENLLSPGGAFNTDLYDNSINVNEGEGTKVLANNVRCAIARALNIQVAVSNNNCNSSNSGNHRPHKSKGKTKRSSSKSS